MAQNYYTDTYENVMEAKPPKKNSYMLHLGLFLVTFITTTIAGLEWTTGAMGPFEFADLAKGLPYSLSMLFILSCHEFGHYFAARAHKVGASLPYFIPFPPIPGFFNFGTLGALIRTRSVIKNNKIMFDVGVAGPIAGFIACLAVLVYGYTNLPSVDYLLAIHPDFFSPEYGQNAVTLEFGDTLLFAGLRELFTSPGQFVPPMSEIYHYPYLCVGWFGLLVTAMNLIPVGQLDGGHIIFSMFGKKIHETVASIAMILLMVLGVGGVMDSFLELNVGFGWSGWIFWAMMLYFFIKVKHPPVPDYVEIGSTRRILGWVSIVILLVSFSPSPFIVIF